MSDHHLISSFNLPRKYSAIALSLDSTVLPGELLETSVSMKDGVSALVEKDLRFLGTEMIQSASVLLRLPQVAAATGQVLYQRFFYSKSFVSCNFEVVAKACVCLASKIEEAPRRARDVIGVFHRLKLRRNRIESNRKPLQPMLLDYAYTVQKNEVIKMERRVLKELGFCVHIRHPHKLITTICAMLECDNETKLVQFAWNLMNDGLRSDVFLRYSPEVIACSCIYFAARRIGRSLPERWHELFDATEDQLYDICFILLELYYRKRTSRTKLDASIEKIKLLKKRLENPGSGGGSTPNPGTGGKFSPARSTQNSPKQPDGKKDKKRAIERDGDKPKASRKIGQKSSGSPPYDGSKKKRLRDASSGSSSSSTPPQKRGRAVNRKQDKKRRMPESGKPTMKQQRSRTGEVPIAKPGMPVQLPYRAPDLNNRFYGPHGGVPGGVMQASRHQQQQQYSRGGHGVEHSTYGPPVDDSMMGGRSRGSSSRHRKRSMSPIAPPPHPSGDGGFPGQGFGSRPLGAPYSRGSIGKKAGASERDRERSYSPDQHRHKTDEVRQMLRGEVKHLKKSSQNSTNNRAPLGRDDGADIRSGQRPAPQPLIDVRRDRNRLSRESSQSDSRSRSKSKSVVTKRRDANSSRLSPSASHVHANHRSHSRSRSVTPPRPPVIPGRRKHRSSTDSGGKSPPISNDASVNGRKVTNQNRDVHPDRQRRPIGALKPDEAGQRGSDKTKNREPQVARRKKSRESSSSDGDDSGSSGSISPPAKKDDRSGAPKSKPDVTQPAGGAKVENRNHSRDSVSKSRTTSSAKKDVHRTQAHFDDADDATDHYLPPPSAEKIAPQLSVKTAPTGDHEPLPRSKKIPVVPPAPDKSEFVAVFNAERRGGNSKRRKDAKETGILVEDDAVRKNRGRIVKLKSSGAQSVGPVVVKYSRRSRSRSPIEKYSNGPPRAYSSKASPHVERKSKKSKRR